MSRNLQVLALTPYPLEGPCARYRAYQFAPELEKLGVSMTVRPFVSSAYYRRFYQAGTTPLKVAHLLLFQLRRSQILSRAAKSDVIFVQREAAIFGPPYLEFWIARLLKKPLVFDFDDAVQFVHPKYGAAAPLVNFVKWPQKTVDLLKWSQAVIAGNRHLETFARQYNSSVSVIPTVVDTQQIQPRPAKKSGPLVLGWMGSHSTASYLDDLWPALRELAGRHEILVRIIGAGKKLEIPGVPLDQKEWSLERELADLYSFDIGLYPIRQDHWALGKSGFKAIQYMAAAVPAVCSPVGATNDIVQHGQNGFLPASSEDWLQVLDNLASDAALREQIGWAGRTTVEERFSVVRQAPKLAEILQGAHQKFGVAP